MHDSIPRLDWLMRPPGLIRNAAVFSAFIIGEHLHFLRTGPGWRRLRGVYSIIGNPVVERQIGRNRRFLQEIESWNLAAEVPARADYSFALAAIDAVEFDASPWNGVTEVVIRAATSRPRRLKLESQDELSDPALRRDFFERLAPTR